ncbi:MAG: hypothetical protein D3903_07560, partial [Candidatus Electrothrix sp. GM3_4]|nr:hypothetical protein [Candidatus Electrothrix sp. GM3_4]
MTSPYIRLFSSVDKKDTAEVGGKGANLGELTGAGFPVPPGFVVTAQTYSNFFASLCLENKLYQLTKAQPKELERYCAPIREAITSTELLSLPSEAILNAHEQLVQERRNNFLCAVRSSATTEDLQDVSFAGQHGTYYYVDGANLLRMIRLCWASLWNTEAVSYRLSHGVEHAAAQMAVVVQEMIRADVSGVTFTVNPVSGAEEIVTESSWGMGAAIVDGRVTPDRYILDRNTLEQSERRIARKRFMVSSTLQAGAKSRLEEILSDMQQQETLPPDHLNTVATWAIRAEEHFGSPQDLEWALADNTFYLLQSRPITAIGLTERTKDPVGQYVLFKPFAENFTEPLTPMTADLGGKAVFPLIRAIQGRAYVDLRYLHPLIPLKISKQELADLLYNFTTETGLSFKQISWLKLPLFLIIGFYAYLIFGVIFSRSLKMPDDFMKHFRMFCREVESNPAYGPVDTLLQFFGLPDLLGSIGNMPIWVNFSAAFNLFLTKFLKMLVDHWTPDSPPDTVSRLCSGQEGVLSTEMGHAIKGLALEATQHHPVRKLLLHCPTEQVLSDLKEIPEADRFLHLINQFLKKHGHRALREIELSSIRWEEDSTQVIGMIRNYLLADIKQMQSKKISVLSRAELEENLRCRLEGLPLERLCRPRWRLLKMFFGWN